MKRLVAVLTVLLVITAVGASGFLTAPGTANGSGAVGTLPPATAVTASLTAPTARTVHVTWSATGPPGGEPVDGYYVERTSGAASAPACGTSPTSPLPAGTFACDDTGVPSGEHTYRVVRVYRTWTALSDASTPVVVPTAVATTLVVAAPAAATAGVPLAVQVTALDQYGETFTAWTGPRCLVITGPSDSPSGASPGYPAAGGCPSGSSVAFSAGVATFDLTLVAAETTALAVTDAASAIAASPSALTVGPGTATQLRFEQQPTTTVAGAAIAPPVTVRVTDDFGNAVTDAGRPVVASVASGPGSLTPASITSVATDATGLATFADLALDLDGTYRLQMTSDGIVATSADFVVTPRPPTVLTAAPSSRGQGAANQVVAITGTDFRPGASADFGGGVTVDSTTFVSATQLTVNLTVAAAAAVGARGVTVTNPDGGTRTGAAAFTVNAAPAPVSLAPASRGQGATNQIVTVTGSAFVSGAVVAFSGAGVTINSTTFVSATQLSVSVSVAPARRSAPAT